MAWEENSCISLNMQLIAILSRIGVSVYTVQHMLGHKNVSTTQIYATMADESKRESVNRITLKPKITPQLKVVGQG